MSPEETALRFVQVFLEFENYFFFSVTALCCYDYVLTLDREIKFIWKTELSFATSLYYAFRYSALFNTIMVLLTRIAWPSWQSNWVGTCGVVLRVQMVLDIIVLVSATIFAALRVYAIFSRNKWMFGLVFLSGIINPAISIYIFMLSLPGIHAVMSFQACSFTIVGNRSSYESWMMAARAASLVSDGLVLTLTCMKTVRMRDSEFITSFLGSSLKDILLRDTVLCFAFLCVINVIGIATGRLPEFIDIWQTWTAILTSVLLSRLALDLREVSATEFDTEGTFYPAPYDPDLSHEEEVVVETSFGELDSVVTGLSSFAYNVAPLSTK
ncbi:uncharacterized protein LAESUDRAFT_727911 [Laetiporus sulphureus 93-53]|uniref:DUF6533 domain-containing protein n=1 Tax=Laetiporus sulphureus 93-53 TaxID=1314785 RepID=A0A165DAH9_9APHY|nr:uncharacterized protein LAESUDRAFT_727911 [Laetiporus sulphureus 93-53]KZT04437.1 hypothetical protein LAESUDRAFT_727911 [Laetiporus sulphureus 93-53]